MSTIAALLVCLTAQPVADSPTALLLPGHEGRVVYYSKGLMEKVVTRRSLDKLYHRPGVKGAIATPDCRNVGKFAWLQIGDDKPELMLVADCAQPAHYASQVRRGLVAETDFATAQRHGFVRHGRTTGRVWLVAGERRK